MLMGTIDIATAMPVEASGPFPKFVNHCGNLSHELRKQRTTDKELISNVADRSEVPDAGLASMLQELQIGGIGASPDVLFDLGILYSSGRIGCVDLVAAHKWFNLAALKGRVDAIALRREISEQMNSDEIALAQREARAWITTH